MRIPSKEELDYKLYEAKQKVKYNFNMAKIRVINDVNKTIAFVADHPKLAAFVGTAGLYAAGEIKKDISYRKKEKREAKERERNEIYKWDPSLQDYWRLRRKMTEKEKVEFANRVKNGESTYEFLKNRKLV